jgi:mannose/fructose/N-acetylgalactosamine-specific phosphotransferase system component IIC
MGEILIWVIGVFVAGSLLVLERRCLGQRALVQPLALCLLVGWLVDEIQTGLWVGVTLQLLSVTPARTVDWALTGAVGAITIMVASRLDIAIAVGSIEASFLVLIAVLLGMMARLVERVFARVDTVTIMSHSPWQETSPASAVERVVYRAIGRWLIMGGLEVVGGVAVALMGVIGASFVRPPGPWINAASQVALPAFGLAVVVSALAEYRLIALSCMSMGLSIVLAWMVLA